jgi:hypothetical protein
MRFLVTLLGLVAGLPSPAEAGWGGCNTAVVVRSRSSFRVRAPLIQVQRVQKVRQVEKVREVERVIVQKEVQPIVVKERVELVHPYVAYTQVPLYSAGYHNGGEEALRLREDNLRQRERAALLEEKVKALEQKLDSLALPQRENSKALPPK